MTIEQKKHVIGIFLDLSKAFDTICHSKLLYRLQNYGIRGSCLDLNKNYLCSRQQVTKFNDIKSLVYHKDLYLDPFFLLYINDIIHLKNQGEFVIFADDTNIFLAAKDKAQAYKTANAVLRSIYMYTKTNQLHINLIKCAHMYFRPNLHYKDRLSCARTTGYDQGLTLSVNGQKVKKLIK